LHFSNNQIDLTGVKTLGEKDISNFVASFASCAHSIRDFECLHLSAGIHVPQDANVANVAKNVANPMSPHVTNVAKKCRHLAVILRDFWPLATLATCGDIFKKVFVGDTPGTLLKGGPGVATPPSPW
jgi:hypothetical protein